MRLKNWNFVSMLRLVDMSGTWDLGLVTPCELALRATMSMASTTRLKVQMPRTTLDEDTTMLEADTLAEQL